MINDLARLCCNRDLAHEELPRPELLILVIPSGRALQAFLPRQQRLPTEHAIDFRPIAGVAHDLSGAIFDELDLVQSVVH